MMHDPPKFVWNGLACTLVEIWMRFYDKS